uniref:Uncharacterized protein n=1 Tax=Cyprinus carpio TaxID=7962 RepID=A0A8C2PYI0_CYPCA
MNYFWMTVILHVTGNFMSVDTNTFFVTEGDSFTLKHDKRKTEEDQEIRMYHDDIEYLIGRCDYLKCTFGNKELGDRLKVYENGSLTITNTKVTDSGDYNIITDSKSILSSRSYSVVVRGFFSFDTDGVSVMEGDSVTLHTGVQMNQKQMISIRIKPRKQIKWYFNQTAIAGIIEYEPFLGVRSFICTKDECKERFRDRLEVDHQTGSLTITDIRTTDSGLYDLLINWDHVISVRSSNVSSNTKIFIVAVHGESICLKAILVFLTSLKCLVIFLAVTFRCFSICLYFNSHIERISSKTH